ncbi:MFS transporter [Kitasatospora sp. DSM 101779]|uniref:MFS transporter n=1 Tax=Kitasatospora sp. DSM 101779 TaxID=2853165 RepID=UPI0021D893FD|nr:MFS transporter [Kitasatospora sp. DSM 101779]MCU7821179.1 MFS transporter [Kitasatospora sp. DSM 101779]
MSAGTRRSTSLLAPVLAANAISVAGTRLTAIAIPWLVLTTTGSATRTGIVAACELTPLVVSKALCGPVIDRLGARRVSVCADLLSAATVALVPLLHLAGLLTFPVLLVLVAVAGAARGPADTSKFTLAPDIADAAGLPLERVTGLVSATERTAMIIAPALAGAVIGATGPADALLVDAASFVVCAVAVGIWAPKRHRPAAEATAEPAAKESYLGQLRGGWAFIVSDRMVRSLVTMVSVTNLVDAAYSAVLLPVWIHDHGYGALELGLIGSAFSVTAAVAAVLAAAYGERVPRRAAFLAGFFLGGVPRFAAMALGAPMWCVVGLALVGGFGSGFINPILSAVFVERIPRDLLGRVSSLAEAAAWAGMPLGGILAGSAIAAAGLAPVLVTAGGVYLVAVVVPGLLPQWSEMERGKRPSDAVQPVPREPQQTQSGA